MSQTSLTGSADSRTLANGTLVNTGALPPGASPMSSPDVRQWEAEQRRTEDQADRARAYVLADRASCSLWEYGTRAGWFDADLRSPSRPRSRHRLYDIFGEWAQDRPVPPSHHHRCSELVRGLFTIGTFAIGVMCRLRAAGALRIRGRQRCFEPVHPRGQRHPASIALAPLFIIWFGIGDVVQDGARLHDAVVLPMSSTRRLLGLRRRSTPRTAVEPRARDGRE